MADIGTSAGVARDESALVGASKLFVFLGNEAWTQAPLVASGDAEALHDMRVALRRLRTTLANLESTRDAPIWNEALRKESRRWRGKLGKVGESLGKVRDLDVLGDYVRAFNTEGSAGLNEFARRLSDERLGRFDAMNHALEKGAEPDGVRERFARWSLGLPAASSSTGLSLGEAARLVLQQRLGETRALGDSLDAGNEERQHDLRKSLRCVRYTLETFAPCFSAPVKKPVKSLVEMQDILGEMQDRSVLNQWIERLWKKAPADVNIFAEHNRARRGELLSEVRALWTKKDDQGLWEKISALKG